MFISRSSVTQPNMIYSYSESDALGNGYQVIIQNIKISLLTHTIIYAMCILHGFERQLFKYIKNLIYQRRRQASGRFAWQRLEQSSADPQITNARWENRTPSWQLHYLIKYSKAPWSSNTKLSWWLFSNIHTSCGVCCLTCHWITDEVIVCIRCGSVPSKSATDVLPCILSMAILQWCNRWSLGMDK